ncbi:hypothetical protein F5X99DRAFT_424771 [Biscogniauxia marginata]|nr:hypothetical protein F5X99DRAFT_424771 [Biscogniauxia marginata]
MQLTTTPVTLLLAATTVLAGPVKRGFSNSNSNSNSNGNGNDDFIEISGRHPDGRTVPVYLSNSFTPTTDRNNDGNNTRLAPRDFSDGWTPDGQHHDLCGDVRWEDLLGIADYRTPADAGDCQAAADALGQQPGWFNVSGAGHGIGSGYGTLAHSGRCTLGVFRQDGREDSFGLGDTDVADMLGYALAHYSTEGKVHVDGEGACGPVWFGLEIYGAENPDVASQADQR